MKLKILRPYLDYVVGETYTIDVPAQARYMIAMNIGKEAVSKDGKPVETAPAPVKKQEKKAVKPVAKKDAVKPAENDDDLS